MNYYLVLQLTQRKQDGVVQITRNTFPYESLDEAKVQWHSVLDTYGDKINKGQDDIYWVYSEVMTIDKSSLNTTRLYRDHIGSLYQEPIEEVTEATETEA